MVLGARVLAEFGDDRTRYENARARRCYAGSAPIARASGTRLVELARVARNRRLADALYLWAFCTLTRSAGARAFYAAHHPRGHTHHQALRALPTGLSASSTAVSNIAAAIRRPSPGHPSTRLLLDKVSPWDV